jgi:hypothetical protein
MWVRRERAEKKIPVTQKTKLRIPKCLSLILFNKKMIMKDKINSFYYYYLKTYLTKLIVNGGCLYVSLSFSLSG